MVWGDEIPLKIAEELKMPLLTEAGKPKNTHKLRERFPFFENRNHHLRAPKIKKSERAASCLQVEPFKTQFFPPKWREGCYFLNYVLMYFCSQEGLRPVSVFLCLRQTSLLTRGFQPAGKSFLRRSKEWLPVGCLVGLWVSIAVVRRTGHRESILRYTGHSGANAGREAPVGTGVGPGDKGWNVGCLTPCAEPSGGAPRGSEKVQERQSALLRVWNPGWRGSGFSRYHPTWLLAFPRILLNASPLATGSLCCLCSVGGEKEGALQDG